MSKELPSFVPAPCFSSTTRRAPLVTKRLRVEPSFSFRSLRACAAPAQRTTDARGFVLPEEGDVVLYQGRWANEDAAGLVSSVRFIESRDAHVVDVVELRRVATDLFAVPGATARRGKSTRWMDVAEVRVVRDATYVPTQDAYRVTGTRDGYAEVVPLDEAARIAAEEEYRRLKFDLMRDTVAVGALGTAAGAAFVSLHVGGAFGAGALASAVYLAMLQAGVDAMGKGGLGPRLLGLRFFVPVVPFLGLAAVNGSAVGSVEGLIGSVSKIDALAIVLGLLTYKAPLFARTGGEFVDGLADFEMGKTGMVGTAVGLAAREIKKRRDSVPVSEAGTGQVVHEEKSRKAVFVFAGPSGAGKSTLIHMLTDEYPGRFSFNVSHTTRPPREGEEDGLDYYFVDIQTFEKMIDEGKFVEYAQVHGQYYGTSYDAVAQVLADGGVCVLDLDVQGVETLRQRKGLEWDPRYVWVAPPSIEALRGRLKARGTETEETLKNRMDTATREIAYAATNNVFDLIVVNNIVEEAYSELRNFVNQSVPVVAE